MTFAALKTEVFRRLNESSSAPVFWSEADVEDAINFAYRELSDESEWYERAITIPLLNDRPYYDLRTNVNSLTVLSAGPCYHSATNRWLQATDQIELDQRDRRWETATGTPQRMWTKGLWWIAYWPRVQADDTTTVRQTFTALPPALSDDDDTPGFPVAYHDGIVEGALSDLYAQDAEADLALKCWAAYEGYESNLRAWVQGRGRVPMRLGR